VRVPNRELTMNHSILAVAAATIAVTFAAGSALAQDAEAGKTEFKKCMVCHAVGEGATNRVGPVLNDVFGRVAGTYEGYKYSKAMIDKGAAGLIWEHDTLAQFLHKPKEFVPGTKMTFAGIADPAVVDNLLAYLVTLSPNYVPAAPADGASSEASSAAP
jgi:cytochrome c2